MIYLFWETRGRGGGKEGEGESKAERDRERETEWRQLSGSSSLFLTFTSHYLITFTFPPHQCHDLDLHGARRRDREGAGERGQGGGRKSDAPLAQENSPHRCARAGIYKDVSTVEHTCGHHNKFMSALPRQTTSLQYMRAHWSLISQWGPGPASSGRHSGLELHVSFSHSIPSAFPRPLPTDGILPSPPLFN